MLVDNNMLCTGSFIINLSTFSTLIHSCDVKIEIYIRQDSESLRHRALASAPTIMPSRSKTLVAFQHIELSDFRDFLFCPFLQQQLILYSHLLNHTSTKVLIHNNADHTIKILLHHRLDCITELPYKSCFTTSVDLYVASTLTTLPIIFYNHNGISIPPTGDLEIELLKGIKIYENREAVGAITCLVNKYLSI